MTSNGFSYFSKIIVHEASIGKTLDKNGWQSGALNSAKMHLDSTQTLCSMEMR